MPGTGAGADSEIIPLAFNSLAGTKFKIISGYRNTTEAALAMERGELEGLAYWSWSAVKSIHPDWVPREEGQSSVPHRHCAGSGNSRRAAHPQSGRRIRSTSRRCEFLLAREILGRPFLAPPDLPPERAAVLRAAFAATMRDPDFLKEAEKAKLDVDLVTGEEVDDGAQAVGICATRSDRSGQAGARSEVSRK